MLKGGLVLIWELHMNLVLTLLCIGFEASRAPLITESLKWPMFFHGSRCSCIEDSPEIQKSHFKIGNQSHLFKLLKNNLVFDLYWGLNLFNFILKSDFTKALFKFWIKIWLLRKDFLNIRIGRIFILISINKKQLF